MGIRVAEDEIRRWEAEGLVPPRPSDRLRQDRLAVMCSPKAAAAVGRMVSVVLPIPPSTNNLYWNVRGKGRVKTDEYRSWIHVAGPMLQGLLVPPRPVSIRLTVHAGTGWRDGVNDLTNVVKPVEDLLVSNGYLENDDCRYVREVRVAFDPERKSRTPAACRVQLLPWSAG